METFINILQAAWWCNAYVGLILLAVVSWFLLIEER